MSGLLSEGRTKLDKKRLYFGTQERMSWVKTPAIEADISKARWSAEGVFLNGGAYVRNSSAAHKRYQFSWNLASQDDIYDIVDYADGVYGAGLIYFLEPFSQKVNCLPSFWASPRLQADDAPSLVKDKRPTLVDTAPNSYSYPTKSAVYTFSAGDEFSTLWLPVPDGYVLHLGVHGSSTGTAAITTTTDESGAPVTVNMLPVNTSALTNTEVSGTNGVTLSAEGEGQLTLAGVIAQVVPVGTPLASGRFRSGRGHSGCRFAPNSPTVHGYSAPEGLDMVGASATLIETGAWER